MQRNIFKDGDVIAGAVAAALGVYITTTASRWTIMNQDGPGPGFFPMGYGIGLIVLSAILILSRFTAKRDTEEDKPFDWPGFIRAGATWGAFVAAAALMSTLGFYISFGLMTFVLVLLVFGRPLQSALVTGVLSAAGFYLVFGLVLDVPMPVGLMGF